MRRLINGKGLVAGAEVRVDYSLQTSGTNERVHAYLMLFTRKQIDDWYDRMVNKHDPSSSQEWILCGSPSYKRHELEVYNRTAGNISYAIDRSDQYTLVFATCDDGMHLTGKIKASFVNPDLHGRLTQHLPAEVLMRPVLYDGLQMVYLLLVALWGYQRVRLLRQQQLVEPMHTAVLAALVARFLEVWSEALYLHVINRDGESHWRLWATKEFAASLSTVSFLTVLLLLSLGWSLIRPSLTHREVSMVASVVVIYVGVAIGRIAEDKTEQEHVLVLSEYVLRSLVLLAVIVALNFNITHLRQSISDTPNPITGGIASLYAKLHQLQVFRWAFLAYLLLPTTLLVLKVAVLSWEFDWINYYLHELTFLLIHVHVACVIAPSNDALLRQAFRH